MIIAIDKARAKIASERKLAMTNTRLSVAHHERIVRLSRLAMLIECEGSITVGMTPPTKTRCRPALTAAVDLTNTATDIIEEAKETLALEGIACTARPEGRCRGVGRKPRFDVNLHGFDRVEKVLTALMPYLRSKRRQAEIVLEFVDCRRRAHKHAAYSNHEWQLVYEVRRLNGKMPHRKAVAKALAYLASPECDQRSRTAEYFRKYVAMCADLTRDLKAA